MHTRVPVKLFIGSAWLLFSAMSHAAIIHDNEAVFQSAAGVVNTETFESYNLFDPVSALPLLGGTFDTLNNGSYPNAYDQSAGGSAHSGIRTLMNNDKLGLPGEGDIIFIADADTEFSALGLWNTGGDDTVRLSIYDSNNNLLATTASLPGESFIGIAELSGAVKAVISAEGGNGWFSIDDLQTATVSSIPVPAAVWLFASGLLALSELARRKAA